MTDEWHNSAVKVGPKPQITSTSDLHDLAGPMWVWNPGNCRQTSSSCGRGTSRPFNICSLSPFDLSYTDEPSPLNKEQAGKKNGVGNGASDGEKDGAGSQQRPLALAEDDVDVLGVVVEGLHTGGTRGVLVPAWQACVPGFKMHHKMIRMDFSYFTIDTFILVSK